MYSAQQHEKQGNELAPAPTRENDNIETRNHVYIITLLSDSPKLIVAFKRISAVEEELNVDLILFTAAKQAMEQGMANPFEDAKTTDIPELSPYVTHERYENPKEHFKHVARALGQITDSNQILIACFAYSRLVCTTAFVLSADFLIAYFHDQLLEENRYLACAVR